MNLNTLHDLFASLTGFSTKWRTVTSPTETPSRRYVRKLKTQHTKSISGREASIPSKIDDPKFKYVNAAESAKTGYLEKRMKIYMEMVKNESNGKVCDGTQISSNGKGLTKPVFSVTKHRVQSSKLVAVGGKG